MNALKVIEGSGSVTKQPSIAKTGDEFFIQLMQSLRHELAPATLATVHTKLKEWSESIEACQKNVKERCLQALKDNGVVATEKGSIQLDVTGDKVLTAKPWRTGYDAKKVEALLRAKNKDPDVYMDREVHYKLSDVKLGAALQAGALTQTELDASCKAGLDKDGNQIWSVQVMNKKD